MGSARAIVTGVLVLAACSDAAPTAPRDRWREGGRTPEPRLEGAAATDGRRVWYVGGITGREEDMRTAQPSRRVDVYDPTAGRWTEGPSLPDDAPKHHLALAVHAGRLYVLGGFDGIIGRGIPGEEFRPVARTYALEGATWRRLADAPLARGGATAQVIRGVIYVAGGTRTEGVDPYPDLYAYDPAADAWSRRAPMPTAREHVASCAVDDRMIVVGGWAGADRVARAEAERYDPATDAWTRLAAMPTARGGLGAAAVGGVCYVIGGEDWQLPPPGTFRAVEGLDARAGTWRAYAPMPTARHGAGVVRFGDEVYVMGGGPRQGNSYLDLIEVYEP